MKVLVIGGGGREHALAWRLAASARVQRVYVAPGNGGTARDARLHNVALTDLQALAGFAQAEKIALTVVGPEAPLPKDSQHRLCLRKTRRARSRSSWADVCFTTRECPATARSPAHLATSKSWDLPTDFLALWDRPDRSIHARPWA